MTHCPLCPRPAATPHDRCRNVLDARIAAMPGLDALMGAVLEPGTAAGASHVSGTRTPPLPCRLEPLSLRSKGGIGTILGTWAEDWRDLRGLSGGAPAGLAGTVMFLRAHLPWAIAEHPAIREFADEIGGITRQCHQAAGLRSDAMRIGECPVLDEEDGDPCGTALFADPYGETIRCRRCRSSWPRARWLVLGGAMNDDREVRAA